MISNLFEPARINGMALKNRFVRSATMESMATADGCPTPELKSLYARLAEGDVGLIITSGSMIEKWKRPPKVLGLQSPLVMHADHHGDAWQDVVAAVHERGAKIAMQIGHLGRQDIPALRGAAPIAPSVVPLKDGDDLPCAMTVDEIGDVVEKFAQACRREKAAGFDAVQFHGAHGNLIHNFMSPFTNKRTDAYGGSTANRSRFMIDIIERSRQLVGPDFPLMIKMNFDDFVVGGLEKDDAVAMAEILARAGIDGIEVSGGTLSESAEHIAVKGIQTKTQEAYFQEYARTLKKHVAIPVILVGGHRTPTVMARLIEEGAADFISMSRPFIREPGLIKRWRSGERTKAKCISCNQCFDNWMFRPMRCYMEGPLTAGPSFYGWHVI